MTPQGRGPAIMAVYLTFLVLSTTATILRVYCRAVVVKRFGWDDRLAIVGWGLFVCHATFAITGVYHGTGQHAWDIKPSSDIVKALKWWWLCEPIYVLSNMAIKASITLMLLRVLVDATQRIILYAVLIITEIYSLAFFLLFIFQCWPPAFFWTRLAGATGSCINTSIVTGGVYAYSGIVCAGDWILFILPMIIVWKLEQLPRHEKVMVGAVLAMSAVASVATIARIPYIHTLTNQADFLYATSDVAIWSCTETGLAIAASGCATLRPLFRHLLGRTRTMLSSSRSSGLTASRRAERSWRPLPCNAGREEAENAENADKIYMSPDLLKSGLSGSNNLHSFVVEESENA